MVEIMIVDLVVSNSTQAHPTISQYAEWILNKIAKATNETFTGLKCMLQGFRICFVLNPSFRA